MKSKSRLVLSQYRKDSDYNDEVGKRYHFPKKYYSLVTLPDSEFIYYEPKKKGKGEYFGYGEIGRVDSDPDDSTMFIAEINGYREFEKPVSLSTPEGEYLEADIQKSAQMSVRQINATTFEEICKKGDLDLDSLGLEAENTESSDGADQDDEPFDAQKIKVDRENMSIFQVLRKIKFGEIQLDPEFQRNVVWDRVRRSRLIESALLRLPLPAFYFDGVDANKWTVVDGLQRLSTLYDFIEKKSFKLSGLEYLTGVAEDCGYDDLPRGMQRELEETPIMLYIIRPDTPPDVKFTIFYRINTGGLVLTAQEIRHALFQGNATILLKKLAKSSQFLKAIDWGVSDTRMDARECVLRFLAFHITPYEEYEKSDLNAFLSNAMRRINELSDQELDKIEQAFYKAMDRAYEVFGKRSFRKFNPETWRRGPVNKALLESWANVLLAYSKVDLINNREAICDKLWHAFQYDYEYSRSLSAGTGSRLSVQRRFQKAHDLVKEVIT